MIRILHLAAILCGALTFAAAAAPQKFDPTGLDATPFSFSKRSHQAEVIAKVDGSYQITTTGDDPYVFVDGVAEMTRTNEPYMLAFEYRAEQDFDKVHFYYQAAGKFSAVDAGMRPSEIWQWHFFDLSTLPKNIDWFRFDFGSREGLRFELRNCRLIKKTGPFQWLRQPHEIITFNPTGYDLTRTDAADGSITITTTGTDPYISTRGIAEQLTPLTPYRIAFQYQIASAAQPMQVLYQTPGGLQVINSKLPPTKTTQTHPTQCVGCVWLGLGMW